MDFLNYKASVENIDNSCTLVHVVCRKSRPISCFPHVENKNVYIKILQDRSNDKYKSQMKVEQWANLINP